MTYVVTGATGNLGGKVVDHLLALGVEPADILACGRDEERLAELAATGVRTARMDYEDRASVEAAIHAGDRVLLVSSSEVGQRVEQHRRVIEVAEEAGVELLAYTSILQGKDSPLLLAGEHRATEELLDGVSVPVVRLRNGWYHENYTEQLEQYLSNEAVVGAAGAGRIAGASRSDYAAAAAAALTVDEVQDAVHELGGDSFTMAELADAVSEVTGERVAYHDLDEDAYRALLVEVGLPEEAAAVYADADARIAEGALDTDADDLERLIGHAPATLHDTLRDHVGQRASAA